MSTFITFLFFSLFLICAHLPARAWGSEVHKAITQLTWMQLSPETQNAIMDILDENDKTDLASLGVWADQIRRERRETGSWHYINIPYTSDDSVTWEKWCPDQGCIVSAIKNQFQKLQNRETLSRIEQQEALKYLIHFIQDLHQPLHVADNNDRGGNDTFVSFFGRENERLHRIWDSGLFYASKDSMESLVLRLKDNEIPMISFQDQSLDEQLNSWLLEGKLITQLYVYEALNESNQWSEEYLERVYPAAELQIVRASKRLSMLLNFIFESA